MSGTRENIESTCYDNRSKATIVESGEQRFRALSNISPTVQKRLCNLLKSDIPSAIDQGLQLNRSGRTFKRPMLCARATFTIVLSFLRTSALLIVSL